MEEASDRKRKRQPLLALVAPNSRLGCACAAAEPASSLALPDVLDAPVGVLECAAARGGGRRYHAVGRCFGSSAEAAAAWDAAARSRGQHIVNTPTTTTEVAAAAALRHKLAAVPTLPDAPADGAWRAREHAALLAADVDAVWTGERDVAQADHASAPGVHLIWSFNAHAWHVRKAKDCKAGWQQRAPRPSAAEAFESNAVFRARCLRALLEVHGDAALDGGADADARLRQCAVRLSGSWVLTFQPLVAAALVRRYGGAGGVVYDPCAGWGGRLLGAAVAGAAAYIACEPAARTHAGLAALAEQYAGGMRVQLERRGAEDFQPAAGSVDVALTSPPYFNLELYSDEPSQSHVKYPTAEWWTTQWLRRVVERTYTALKPGGYFLVNVANNRQLLEGGCDLEGATQASAAHAGFEAHGCLRMLKPTAPGVDGAATRSVDSAEPIYVFRKPLVAAPPAAVGGADKSTRALGALLAGW